MRYTMTASYDYTIPKRILLTEREVIRFLGLSPSDVRREVYRQNADSTEYVLKCNGISLVRYIVFKESIYYASRENKCVIMNLYRARTHFSDAGKRMCITTTREIPLHLRTYSVLSAFCL